MNATWVPSAAAAAAGATSISVTGAVGTRSDFEKELGNDCGLSFSGIGRCVLMIFYYVAMALPSLLLWASAQFFNAMISLGIDSKLTSDSTLFPKLGQSFEIFPIYFYPCFALCGYSNNFGFESRNQNGDNKCDNHGPAH